MDAEKVAVWCARRLGYPITDIELTEENFYSAFEESILVYNSLVNSFSARDNLLTLSGQPTASLHLESQYIQPTLTGVFKLAKQYGTEVGAGGTQIWYTGSIDLVPDKQVYDLTDPASTTIEIGDFQTDKFIIRRIFHEDTSPLARYLDPIGYSGIANQEFLNQFGWGNMGIQYTLMPLHYDLLRLQGVEMHNQIRRSTHTFQLTGNRIRIFPIPREQSKLFFHYTLDGDVIDYNNDNNNNLETGVISDFSNIPYGIKKYKIINEIGKNWIRRYALALSKEMLGYVRGKYASIPMTLDNEVTLNGAELIGSAQSEKDALVVEMNEMLDSMSRQSQLERKQAEDTALSSQLKFVPFKIYVK